MDESECVFFLGWKVARDIDLNIFGQDPAPKTHNKMGPNYSYKWSYHPYNKWP